MKRTCCVLLCGALIGASVLLSAPAFAAPPPQIRFLDVDSASYGSYLGIYGRGFGTDQGTVNIGSATVVDYRLWSDGLIILRIPAGASTGKVQVKLKNSTTLDYPTPLAVHVGTIYYVSANTGNDLGSGDEQSPFQSIRKALSVVVPGDTILLSEGVYDEKDPADIPSPALFVKSSLTGTATKPITIRGLGIEIPTIRGSTEPSRDNPVVYLGSDYVRLARVKVDGTGNLSSGVSVQGSNVWLSGVEVTAFTGQGVLSGENTGLMLLGSHVHHGGTTVGESHAVVITGSTGTVRDNEIDHVDNGYGLLLQYQTQASMLVNNNLIHDVGGAGIGLSRVKGGNRIFNNVLWNTGVSLGCLCGIEVGYGAQSGEAASVADRVYYNTFAGPGTIGASLVDRSGNVEMHGNVFANFQAGIAIEDEAAKAALRSSHNLYFYEGGTTQFRWGEGWIDFDTFKTQAGQENFSKVADPLLVDPAKLNFRLGTGSPAIDQGGGPDQPNSDFDGVARPLGTEKDWGAFEAEPGDAGAPDGGPDGTAPEGGDSGKGGSAGSAGAAGAAGDSGVTDGAAEDGAAGAAPPAGGDDGGCGCSVPGSNRSVPMLLLAALAAGIAARRRRA